MYTMFSNKFGCFVLVLFTFGWVPVVVVAAVAAFDIAELDAVPFADQKNSAE